MKKTKQKFVIFCTGNIIGELRRAWDLDDLMATMIRRHNSLWSTIEWRDNDGRRVVLTRDFLIEGMTVQECIDDWLTHAETADFEEPIRFMTRQFGRNDDL